MLTPFGGFEKHWFQKADLVLTPFGGFEKPWFQKADLVLTPFGGFTKPQGRSTYFSKPTNGVNTRSAFETNEWSGATRGQYFVVAK